MCDWFAYDLILYNVIGILYMGVWEELGLERTYERAVSNTANTGIVGIG